MVKKFAVHSDVQYKTQSKYKNERAPKGYVPVLVGDEAEAEERVLVRVSLLNDPRMSELLENAAQEFGYEQRGILRLPCGAERLRWVVDEILKAN